MSATDETAEPQFRDWGVLTLADGFRVFELSKVRSGDWRFMSLRDVLADEYRSSGIHLVTFLNVASYLRFRRRNQEDVQVSMRRRFVYELGVGLVEAIGYLAPRAEQDKPVLIPRRVWQIGHLNWEQAQFEGAGLTFVDVRIPIPFSSALLDDATVPVEPIPELRPFTDSDERRQWLGLPVSAAARLVESITLAAKRMGRPSHRAAIECAYEALKPHDGLADKELFHRIREHVKCAEGLNNDKGLGDSAIQKHVRRLRLGDRERKNG